MKLKFKPTLGKVLLQSAVGEFFQHIFVIVLVTYLMLLLAETIWEESASSVFNLNYLLIAVIVTGIPAVLTARSQPEERKSDEPLGFGGIALSAIAGIAGAVLVWYKTRDIGWPSVIMSIVSCVLIFILSLLILKERDEEENS